jgi:hypothetical protein
VIADLTEQVITHSGFANPQQPRGNATHPHVWGVFLPCGNTALSARSSSPGHSNRLREPVARQRPRKKLQKCDWGVSAQVDEALDNGLKFGDGCHEAPPQAELPQSPPPPQPPPSLAPSLPPSELLELSPRPSVPPSNEASEKSPPQ